MDKAFPGKFLGYIYNFSLGEGVYRKDDNIFSSLLGDISISNTCNPPKISVKSINTKIYKPKIGDEVYAIIKKITNNYVNCDILATKYNKLDSSIQALIRPENIRAEYKDFDINTCFKPGDIILSKIIATDLTNSVYLSTQDVEHGVVIAKGLHSNSIMMPISLNEMKCLICDINEYRKVAKPNI